MGPDHRGQLGAGQTVHHRGGQLADQVRGPGAHQLGSQQDFGFFVENQLDEATVLVLDDGFAIG